MGQWLSAIGEYSVEQVGSWTIFSCKLHIVLWSLMILHPSDNYPSGLTAFGIASTLVCATWTDYTRQRWPVLIYISIALTISSICILVWSSPTGLKFFAYCEIPLNHCFFSSNNNVHLRRSKTCQELPTPGRRQPSRELSFVINELYFIPTCLPRRWANQICADDSQERAIVLASMKYVRQPLFLYYM